MLSQTKVDAFAAMDAAIEQLRNAYREEDDEMGRGIVTGWLLVTNEMMLWNDGDDSKPDDDEDMRNVVGAFSKRGQPPMLSKALAHEYLTHDLLSNLRKE